MALLQRPQTLERFLFILVQRLEKIINHLINSSRKKCFDRLLLIYGKLPWKFGLAKKFREIKESINIIRRIHTLILKQRTKEALSSKKKIQMQGHY
jgi:hypothetical protein